jgi:hypothetical protein
VSIINGVLFSLFYLSSSLSLLSLSSLSLISLFSLPSLSLWMILFSQRELSKCSEILHGFLTHKKIKFGVNKNSGDPQCPRGVDFVGFFFLKKTEKCLELPEIGK